MGVLSENAIIGASAAGGYDIDQSLRFDDGDSAYLSRTPSSAGNRKTWTFSCWVKRKVGTYQVLFGTGTIATGTTAGTIYFEDNGRLYLWDPGNGTSKLTTAYYRDPSAWYHVVVVMDATNTIARTYINGEEVTDFQSPTNPSNADGNLNNTTLHTIGRDGSSSAYFYDGYLAEVHFIDGQALTPASFGETNSATNQWVPIEVTGMTYGTNGFYQKYSATELANSFTDDITQKYTAPAGITSVEVLVVAGGGGGGGSDTSGETGGGGGSGGIVHHATYTTVPGQSYDVTVGVGGAGGPSGGGSYQPDNRGGENGANSTFGSITAIGGGGGSAVAGYDGGSGGGAGRGNTDQGTGTQGDSGGGTGYGNNGGQGGGNTESGGGGGANAVGAGGTSGTGGAGGAGQLFSNFTSYGVSGYFGGGGGGGYNASGGSGGGGAGGNSSAGSAGTTATGGGGGGAHNVNSGGAGGSGTVIVYDGTTYTQYSATTQHTITANGDVANSRAQKKIGSSSIKFDGTGDKLTVPSSSDWNPYNTSFTAEFWLNVDSFAHQYDWLIGNSQADPSGWNIQLEQSGSKVNFLVGNGSSWQINTVSSGTGYAISTDTWYHIAVVKNGTAWAMYVDGTSRATGTATGHDYTAALDIGGSTLWSGRDFDGYLDEIRISDSARYTSAFTPSTTAFTADANTVLLIHSDWTGGLGADSSGNTNDFTPTNLGSEDMVLDSPTNNFATLNSILDVRSGTTITLSEGNTKWTNTAGGTAGVMTGTFSATDKIYFEGVPTTLGSEPIIGFASDDKTAAQLGPGHNTNADTFIYEVASTGRFCNGSTIDTGPSVVSAGDIISVAYDSSSGKVWFAVNGTWYNSGDPAAGTNASFTIASSHKDKLVPAIGGYNSGVWKVNFGQDSSFAGAKTAQGNQDGNNKGDFYYTPPTGYLALCSDNLSDPSIADPTAHFGVLTWTGNGSTSARTITGDIPNDADAVWIKDRSSAYHHIWMDSIRGYSSLKQLMPDQNFAEGTTSGGSVGDRYGWVSDTGTGSIEITGNASYSPLWTNNNTDNYVGWVWKAGGTAVSNTDGTITSSVSANTEAGFSIVSYTGTGANATVGHGLSQAPELIIVKNRDMTNEWPVGTTEGGLDFTDYLKLDGVRAVADDDRQFNDTDPTASVFSVGTYDGTNESSDNHIAYCFHSVEGYSKVGSYEGNANADGPFVYTGFSPSFVMVKGVDTSDNWTMWDNKRPGYNVTNEELNADDPAAESANAPDIDFTSNGFKRRDTAVNASSTYLYIAFAESPFKTANAR